MRLAWGLVGIHGWGKLPCHAGCRDFHLYSSDALISRCARISSVFPFGDHLSSPKCGGSSFLLEVMRALLGTPGSTGTVKGVWTIPI